jgi:hypothetical protein
MSTFASSERSRTRVGHILVLLVSVAAGSAAFWLARQGHRRPPTPRGMVFRAEAREVKSPLDRFEVRAMDRGGRAVAVFAPAIGDFPATLETYAFPAGGRLERLVGPDASRAWSDLAPPAGGAEPATTFDFDGDGTTDDLVTGAVIVVPEDYGVVRVRSGRDGRTLFEDADELEYEGGDRAIPLGDVDGDGCSELALLHPRMNRSDYDIEPCDWLLGAKSWVTVVSGARATR